MRKCKYCQSIFVCWNWLHVPKQRLKELNPQKYIHDDSWGHECWKCTGVQETDIKVTDGIPYWLLKFIFQYFVKYEQKDLYQ